MTRIKLQKHDWKFPIFIPIAIIGVLTYQFFSVQNILTKEKTLNQKLISPKELSSFDKKHILIFVSPSREPRILHFFDAQTWNSYSFNERKDYIPPIVQNPIELKNLFYSFSTATGKNDSWVECKVSKNQQEIYSTECKFSNVAAKKNPSYLFRYDYKFHQNLSIEVKNIEYKPIISNFDDLTKNNPKTWAQIFFFSAILQYLLIPGYFFFKRKLKALYDKYKGIPNYDNLPIPRVKHK